MDPLLILLAGMAVVICSILLLRLHAFLALILGALVVGLLSTPDAIENSVLNDSRARREAKKQAETNFTRLEFKGTPEQLAYAILSIHAMELAEQSSIQRVAEAFGRACAKLGILIAMAAIIGKCLLESGAAERIIRSALNWLGEKRAPLAFTGSGFLLGTPVFFDTVFYLMIPLGKTLALRFRENYGLYVMTIVAGATMAHSLVPPTPGPLLVATELGIDIGTMMLAGIVVGFFTCATGYVYAHWVNGFEKWKVPLRDSSESPLASLEAGTQRDESELPPLWLALLPVVLPVVLISGNTVLQKLLPGSPDWLLQIFGAAGDKNIALILAAAVALALLVRQKRGDQGAMASAVQTALASGGVIILITAAGAGFGGVLQQTNIADRIEELAKHYDMSGLMLLPLVFLTTAVIRTAQGSATVAMITSVGIFAGMATSLPFHPVYLAMAIGCGSKPFPWMNDSGFWVINRMSGITLGESFRSVSFLMTVMAVDGLIVVMLLAWLFPMAN